MKYYVPEIWKDVKGYEDVYEVSNLGNVRRKIKNLSASTTPDMYKSVSLCKNGECKSKTIHRIVAEAFLEKEEYKDFVNHKDCNKQNNNVDNLEWVTAYENILHAVENNRQRDQTGEKNNMCKLTEQDVLEIRNFKRNGMSTYSIHKQFYPHLHQQTIYAVIQRRIWKHIQ